MSLGLNANQAYKKYKERGGKMNFAEFLDCERKKMYSANGDENELVLTNKSLNDSLQHAINATLNTGGLKNEVSNKTVFGINRYIFIGGTILAVSAIIFLLINKKS